MEMGIGLLGRPEVIIKRKFRWMLEITSRCGYIGPHFVKSAGRPQIDIDETELHFRNAVTWIPGKGKWQPLTVTYIDTTHVELQGLYNWLATVYGQIGDIAGPTPGGPVFLPQGEKSDWSGLAKLVLFDGCGNPLETWLLDSCFPQSIKWGDLDYSDSAECTIELTLRFSEVTYIPNPACGMTAPKSCCSGCKPPSTIATGPPVGIVV
jgi:hypothetical protein